MIDFTIGLIIGAFCFLLFTDAIPRHEINAKGYAEYNQTTGDWQWKAKEDVCKTLQSGE